MRVPKRVLVGEVIDRVGLSRVALELRAAGLYPRRYLTILTYHRVIEPGSVGFDPEVMDTNADTFERDVRVLKQWFTFVDSRDVGRHLAGEEPLPDNPAMITFDDGYRDNHDIALPILGRHGAKATFFVASRFISERRIFWWERIHHLVAHARGARLQLRYPEALELPLGNPGDREKAARRLLRIAKDHVGIDIDRLLEEVAAAVGVPLSADEERRLADGMVMTWDQLRALRDAGMDVQSHSHAHLIFSTITPDRIEQDLGRARQVLEAELERPVQAVAYPAGKKLTGATREAVARAGYSLGFTNASGVARLDTPLDALAVPRTATARDLSGPFFRAGLAFPSVMYGAR